MNIIPLEIEGLLLVELKVYEDSRGFFMERFNEAALAESGIPIRFVQDNHSRSKPGVLRGLHFQTSPSQGKLVGVMRGAIWDVAVDLRPRSNTFGKSLGVELNEKKPQLLWIPSGFAHGFCVLGDEPADVLYKVDSYYSPASEGGIHWADPDLAIRWPITEPVVSPRDARLGSFHDFKNQLNATQGETLL